MGCPHVLTFINPHAGTRNNLPGAKSNAAFTSDRQRPQIKKDLACLGKGLAYNVFVANRTGDDFSVSE